jgi:putative transposase
MSERRLRRTPGGVCWVGLQLVWCPKYRCRVLGARVAHRRGELPEQIEGAQGWQIVATEVMSDHAHVVVRVFKGRTARVLRQEFPHLRRFADVLWLPAYFAASAAL